MKGKNAAEVLIVPEFLHSAERVPKRTMAQGERKYIVAEYFHYAYAEQIFGPCFYHHAVWIQNLTAVQGEGK